MDTGTLHNLTPTLKSPSQKRRRLPLYTYNFAAQSLRNAERKPLNAIFKSRSTFLSHSGKNTERSSSPYWFLDTISEEQNYESNWLADNTSTVLTNKMPMTCKGYDPAAIKDGNLTFKLMKILRFSIIWGKHNHLLNDGMVVLRVGQVLEGLEGGPLGRFVALLDHVEVFAGAEHGGRVLLQKARDLVQPKIAVPVRVNKRNRFLLSHMWASWRS